MTQTPPLAKFYVASGLANAGPANFFRDALLAEGYAQTYDWTKHGAVAAYGTERLREVASAELRGVAEADFVLVVLPGGRGTHFEMGAAYATGKPVFLYTPKITHIEAHPDTCAFYHLPRVQTFYGSPAKAAANIATAVAMTLRNERARLANTAAAEAQIAQPGDAAEAEIARLLRECEKYQTRIDLLRVTLMRADLVCASPDAAVAKQQALGDTAEAPVLRELHSLRRVVEDIQALAAKHGLLTGPTD